MTMQKRDPDQYLQDELAKELLRLGDEPAEFKPTQYYDPDGDFIEIINQPGSYDAERVSSVLTLYYSLETREPIGLKIKGVQYLLRKYRALSIAAIDGKIMLAHLVIAGSGEGSESEADALRLRYRKVYEDLLNLVKGKNIEGAELAAAH